MTSRDKRYAEWLASHVNKWGHPPSPGEAWAEAERQALERAAELCERFIPSHAYMTTPVENAANAIRALMQDASSVASKEEPGP